MTKSDQLLDKAETVGDLKVLVEEMPGVQRRRPQDRSVGGGGGGGGNGWQAEARAGAVVLGSIPEEGKVSLVAAFSPEVIEK